MNRSAWEKRLYVVYPAGLEALLGIEGEDEIGAEWLIGFDGDGQAFIGELIVFGNIAVGACESNEFSVELTDLKSEGFSCVEDEAAGDDRGVTVRASVEVPEEGITQADDDLGGGADPLGDVGVVEVECGDQAGVCDFEGGGGCAGRKIAFW